jgi:hypothetical protein
MASKTPGALLGLSSSGGGVRAASRFSRDGSGQSLGRELKLLCNPLIVLETTRCP